MKALIATLTVCLLLLFCSSSPTSAQTRSRRSTPQKRRAPASSSSTHLGETQKNAARLKLGDQIKNLTRFLYLYGRFSKDLELTGSQSGAEDVAAKTRAALLNSMHGISEGLDQLEAQFRLTPGLQQSYARLSGVAERASNAERKASANQLDQAGRLLIEVVNQLTDVLLEM
ncbi:MAG: hypothetical protein LC754_10305 [Acidobacteria bacterium]|nr:hypothetical protein [Acidobacteriota bacterium]